jgi:hypothetical protein
VASSQIHVEPANPSVVEKLTSSQSNVGIGGVEIPVVELPPKPCISIPLTNRVDHQFDFENSNVAVSEESELNDASIRPFRLVPVAFYDSVALTSSLVPVALYH